MCSTSRRMSGKAPSSSSKKPRTPPHPAEDADRDEVVDDVGVVERGHGVQVAPVDRVEDRGRHVGRGDCLQVHQLPPGRDRRWCDRRRGPPMATFHREAGTRKGPGGADQPGSEVGGPVHVAAGGQVAALHRRAPRASRGSPGRPGRRPRSRRRLPSGPGRAAPGGRAPRRTSRARACRAPVDRPRRAAVVRRRRPRRGGRPGSPGPRPRRPRDGDDREPRPARSEAPIPVAQSAASTTTTASSSVQPASSSSIRASAAAAPSTTVTEAQPPSRRVPTVRSRCGTPAGSRSSALGRPIRRPSPAASSSPATLTWRPAPPRPGRPAPCRASRAARCRSRP